MSVYIVAYLLFAVITYGVKRINGNKEKKRYIQVCLIYGIITILLAFRHQSMGIDLGYNRGYGYLNSFENIARYSWKQIFALESYLNYEMGYVWFNKLISFISSERQMLLIACAIVSIVPVAMTVYKKSNDILFSTIIYMALPSFLMLFSGLRQGIAIAVCFCSIHFVERKEWKKFIIAIIIATAFHTSAFLFLLSYPAYHIQLDRKWRIATVPIVFAIYLLKYPLFSILSKILKKSAVPDDNGAYMLFLVFVLIYCFCIVFSRQDKKLNGYMNIFYLACICQCFGGVYSTAIRVGYYFMIILCLLLPRIMQNIKDYATYTIIKIVLYICFVTFGLYSIADTYWAMANPYIWFWEMT